MLIQQLFCVEREGGKEARFLWNLNSLLNKKKKKDSGNYWIRVVELISEFENISKMRTWAFYHIQEQHALLKGGLSGCPSTCVYIYSSAYNSLVITLVQKCSWKSMKKKHIISASFHSFLFIADAFITLTGIYISHKKYWTSFKFSISLRMKGMVCWCNLPVTLAK